MDLLRARVGPERRDGRVARATLRRPPEQLTHQHAPVNFLTPLDSRTLLYVARAEDWSGPWLWALDVESKLTRRVTAGLEQYTSVSASRDGRRVVATVANPTAAPLARAAARSTRRGSRCAALLCARPNGPWRRASAGRRCSICRSPPAGPVTGSGDSRTGRRSKCGRAPTACCPSPLRCRRTAVAWPSSSDSRGNGASPSCRRTAPTRGHWLPSIEIQGAARAGHRRLVARRHLDRHWRQRRAGPGVVQDPGRRRRAGAAGQWRSARIRSGRRMVT